jgi:triosephosphate isomerase
MSTLARKLLIAGNWKMNLNSSEASELAESVVNQVGTQMEVAVCVCPTYTSLETVSQKVVNSNIALGAQNMHQENSGAYTGEISAEMLRHLFVSFVILGHSERRQYFGETDSDVNKKALVALEASLKPIVCVGESLEQRESGQLESVIESQIKGALQNVSPSHADQLVIAYEPIWAIGTGKTATPEDAEAVHAFIRKLLVEQLGAEAAGKIRILYGGSMKPENAEELLAQENIDGGLIGGASLKAHAFTSIVESAIKLAS